MRSSQMDKCSLAGSLLLGEWWASAKLQRGQVQVMGCYRNKLMAGGMPSFLAGGYIIKVSISEREQKTSSLEAGAERDTEA